MSFEDGKAAIEAAIQQDSEGDTLGLTAELSSDDQAAPSTPPGEETPSAAPQRERDEFGRFKVTQPETPAADTPDLFEGGTVNPDELIAQHPELAPFVKQLQGEWTRKTQSLAEQRKELESFGDPQSLQEAVQLYQVLQDPQNWPAVHKNLSTAMQQMGLSPAEADAEASRQIAEQQASASPDLSASLAALKSDPELAPFAAAFEQMQSKLQGFEQTFTQAAEEAQFTQMQTALVNELTTMENTIRQDNPKYTQEDIDSIYELASYYDGNLLAAEKQYAEILARAGSRYIDSKQAPAGVEPVSGGATVSEPVPEKPQTLSDVTEAAIARLDQAGMSEFAW